MDALTLLRTARAAGLTVRPGGELGEFLVIRGPREAAGIVRMIGQQKAEVLETLRREVLGRLAGFDLDSPEEIAFIHGLAAEGWARRKLIELLNEDTECRFRRRSRAVCT
jgi:hypothetical protein